MNNVLWSNSMKFSLNNIYYFVKKTFSLIFCKVFERWWTSFENDHVSILFGHRRKGVRPIGLRKSKTAWCNKKAWFAQNLKIPLKTNVNPLYLFEITTDWSEISIFSGEKRQKSSNKCLKRGLFECWIQRSTFLSRLGRRGTSRRPTIAAYTIFAKDFDMNKLFV